MSEHFTRSTISENCPMCGGTGWRSATIDAHGNSRVTRCECRKRSRRARPLKRKAVTLGPRICVNCLLNNCSECDRDGCVCPCIAAVNSANRETGRLFP
jgi:hypothetical protein